MPKLELLPPPYHASVTAEHRMRPMAPIARHPSQRANPRLPIAHCTGTTHCDVETNHTLWIGATVLTDDVVSWIMAWAMFILMIFQPRASWRAESSSTDAHILYDDNGYGRRIRREKHIGRKPRGMGGISAPRGTVLSRITSSVLRGP